MTTTTPDVATTPEVTVTPYRERFTSCASCRGEARWTVTGPHLARTTACDRHRSTWERRARHGQGSAKRARP